MPEKFYLGIDWGGSKTALVLTDSSGDIVWRNTDETGRVKDYSDALGRLNKLIASALNYASQNGGEIAASCCARMYRTVGCGWWTC